MKKQSRADKAADKRVEKAYYATCCGCVINMMDIPKVFAAGRKALADNPAITDAELGVAVRAYVDTIRDKAA